MAYIFPVNPFDGQLYPVPAQPGALQYQWNAELKVWLIYSPLGVQSVTGILPIVVNNGTDNAVVSINLATPSAAGSMSAQDKTKLDAIPDDAAAGTVTQINTGTGLSGGPITTNGTVKLEPATVSTLGGVSVGDNIDVSATGQISIPAARFGVTSINLGPGLIGSPSPITTTGTITAALATRLSVGSVRIGSGIAVAPDGTISADGSLSHVGVLAWVSVRVTQGSPPIFTVLEGYNVSSLVWGGSSQAPRVRINFQNALVDANYGFAFGTTSSQYGASAALYQRNHNITTGFRSTTFVELQLVTFLTNNWTTPGGTFVWNDWGSANGSTEANSGLSAFDIAIIDSQNF